MPSVARVVKSSSGFSLEACCYSDANPIGTGGRGSSAISISAAAYCSLQRLRQYRLSGEVGNGTASGLRRIPKQSCPMRTDAPI